MAAEAAHVELHLARALHRIDMKENARVGGDSADLLHRLEDAGLVVGQHHANQPRLGPDRALNLRRVDKAAGLGLDEGGLHATFGQAMGRLQDRRVLDRRGNEVVAGTQKAKERRVVALGAAGVEHHLGLMAVEELRHGLAGLIHGRVRLLAVQVDRGRVAETFHPIRTHCLKYLRQ